MFDTRQPACVQTPGSVVFASPLETVALLRSGGEGMEEKKKKGRRPIGPSLASRVPPLSPSSSRSSSHPHNYLFHAGL